MILITELILLVLEKYYIYDMLLCIIISCINIDIKVYCDKYHNMNFNTTKPPSGIEVRSTLNIPVCNQITYNDQGILGSSTSCAICSCIDYQRLMQNENFIPSYIFIYYSEIEQ
jgi:hypothetical protein